MRFGSSLVEVGSVLLLGVLASAGVEAWGGLFNRFNPSMLSNLGYGGSYGKEMYQNQKNVRTKTRKLLQGPRLDIWQFDWEPHKSHFWTDFEAL